MKKTSFITMLCLMAALCLLCTGCGKGNTPDDKNQGTTPDTMDTTDTETSDLPEANGDFSAYEGIWVAGEQYAYDYIEIDADGAFILYGDGEVAVTGKLRYEEEYECIYAYDDSDDSGCQFRLEDGESLYIGAYGYFYRGEAVNNKDGGDENDNFIDSPILFSELNGTWYLDGDLSAESYISLDTFGSWYLYKRTPGEAEPELLDYGNLIYADDESCTFYAVSSLDDSISYTVWMQDENSFLFGENNDSYERME